MKKLEIIKVNNYIYTLKDEESNIYEFTLEFHDLKSLPQEGDYIFMSEELLDKEYQEYSDFYAFGALNDPSGRIIKRTHNIQDVIVISNNSNKKYLKRLYG